MADLSDRLHEIDGRGAWLTAGLDVWAPGDGSREVTRVQIAADDAWPDVDWTAMEMDLEPEPELDVATSGVAPKPSRLPSESEVRSWYTAPSSVPSMKPSAFR